MVMPEILVWALGVISAIGLAFMAWVGITLFSIKTTLAVLEKNSEAAGKNHDGLVEWIRRIDGLQQQHASDIAVLKSKDKNS